ncbi:MAG: transglycosylase SLT domain-containing protein [Roseburia sp.]
MRKVRKIIFSGIFVGSTLSWMHQTHAGVVAPEQRINSNTAIVELATYCDERMKASGMEAIDGQAMDSTGFLPLAVDMEEEQQKEIYRICTEYSIDFALVMAMIKHESGYQSDAISQTSDYGLMQINKVNHAWLSESVGVTDYLNPYENVQAGCFLLRQLFEKYHDIDMVLMAYNMGEEGAAQLWEKGTFSTDYTSKVMNTQQDFIKQLNEQEEKEVKMRENTNPGFNPNATLEEMERAHEESGTEFIIAAGRIQGIVHTQP